MYEVVDYSLKEISLNYVVIISACLLLFPIVDLIVTAVKGGADRWR
jgi:hypothetical protein